MKNLSICIVGKDKADFLKQCMEFCLKLSKRISYVDLGSTDNSIEIAKTYGVHVSPDGSLLEVPESLKKRHQTGWILFLKPDEMIAYRSKVELKDILHKSQADGYSMVVKDEIAPAVLDHYRWANAPCKQQACTAPLSLSKVEIRVVRPSFFDDVLKYMISSSRQVDFSFQSQLLKGIQILPIQLKKSPENSPLEKRAQEIEYLKQEISYGLDESEDAIEFGDNFLIYSVITKEDLARYYRGVELGFGNEKMYLTMLHYLGKFGRFEEARDFFETWESKWGFFDTTEPYRLAGIIYANLFDWDRSVACFEKYLDSPRKNFIGEVTSSLAKSYLLQGKREKAISTLRRSFACRNNMLFDRILLDSIDRADWEPVKLSLCMIARDEEVSIRRALQSVSQVVDEIIIVDTGSKDGTKETAREFGGRIVELPWDDDFSSARNAGIRAATGDYILCMDADEFIDPRERINLLLTKQILSAKPHTAYRVKIEQEEEAEEMLVMLRLPKMPLADYPIRLIPASGNAYFEGTAFETAERSLLVSGAPIESMDMFKISHANLSRPWRDARMVAAVHKAFSFIEDFDIVFKGIQFLIRNGDISNALKWFKNSHFKNPKLLAKIAAYFLMHGQNDFREIIAPGIEEFPESLELKLAQAWLCYTEGKNEEVLAILAPHVDTGENILERVDAARMHYIYSMSLLHTGRLHEGIDHMIDARDIDPHNILYKVGGVYALFRGDHWDGIIAAVNDILKQEGVNFDTTVHTVSDMSVILLRLSQHLINEKKWEASLILENIVEEMIGSKMLNKTGIDDRQTA